MSFFFNDTATTEIYTLSLHDALPISKPVLIAGHIRPTQAELGGVGSQGRAHDGDKESEDQGSSKTGTRSEEHTSELQSRLHLVCRLLLEKKKQTEQARTRAQLRT